MNGFLYMDLMNGFLYMNKLGIAKEQWEIRQFANLSYSQFAQLSLLTFLFLSFSNICSFVSGTGASMFCAGCSGRERVKTVQLQILELLLSTTQQPGEETDTGEKFLKTFCPRGCLDCVRLLTDSSSQFRQERFNVWKKTTFAHIVFSLGISFSIPFAFSR